DPHRSCLPSPSAPPRPVLGQRSPRMPPLPPLDPTRSPSARLIAMLSALTVAAGALLGTAPPVHALGPDPSAAGPDEGAGAIGEDSVTVPGSHSAAMGCAGDWLPSCEDYQLTPDHASGLYQRSTDLHDWRRDTME